MTSFTKLLTFSLFCLSLFLLHVADAAQTKFATDTLDAYAPFEELIQVTPSDATVYSPPLRGCIVESVGGGTNLVLTPTKNASSVTITVAAGQLIPVMASMIGASTTATVICGR